MSDYHQRFFEEELAPLDLAGRAVLELGAGEGELLSLLSRRSPRPSRLVGINLHQPQSAAPAGCELLRMDAAALGFAANSFDLIYSLATFEHLHDLPATLREAARVLKLGGALVAVWSPIWNGFNGHHFGSTLSAPDHRDIELPWAHLIFGRERLGGYLVRGEGFSVAEAEYAVRLIYESGLLNFQTTAGYRRALAECGLLVERFDAAPVDFAGLLDRVGGKIAAGVLGAEDFLAFLRRTPDEDLLTYKLRATLRKRV